jgi:hypothetical protein
MGDRDRLDTLARQRLAEREAAAARRGQERAATAAEADARRAGFDDLAGWCEGTFAGYALPETGHVLGVSRIPWAHACNLDIYLGDARVPPGGDCVGLSVEHGGPETGGERRVVLLTLVRAGVAGFEVYTEDGSRTFASSEEVKDHLLRFVADAGADWLRALFEKLARGKFWKKG